MPPIRENKNFIGWTRDVLGNERGQTISQFEFAKMIGKSRAQVQRYEREGLPQQIDRAMLTKLGSEVSAADRALLLRGEKALAARLLAEARQNGVEVS